MTGDSGAGLRGEDPRQVLAVELQRLRVKSGKSLRELAACVHSSDSALSRYLTGRVVPPWAIVEAISGLSGGDVATLQALWTQARSVRMSDQLSEQSDQPGQQKEPAEQPDDGRVPHAPSQESGIGPVSAAGGPPRVQWSRARLATLAVLGALTLMVGTGVAVREITLRSIHDGPTALTPYAPMPNMPIPLSTPASPGGETPHLPTPTASPSPGSGAALPVNASPSGAARKPSPSEPSPFKPSPSKPSTSPTPQQIPKPSSSSLPSPSAPAPAPAATPLPVGVYQYSAESDPSRCLDVADGGRGVQVWSCEGNGNQKWRYNVHTDGGTIQNQASSQCITAKGVGAQLIQSPCMPAETHADQKWLALHDGAGWYFESLQWRGQCIDVFDFGRGNVVQLWKCHQGLNQLWS